MTPNRRPRCLPARASVSREIAPEIVIEAGVGLRRHGPAAAQEWRASRIALMFVALLAAAAAPILVFGMPALADYPNHLARLYAIGALGRDPLLARYYDISWHLVPNLALDALVPPLAKAVGIFAAGKLFLLLLVAMLPAGAAALHRALYGRASLWPLAAFLFIYTVDFNLGLLNYLFATALALLATAAWIRLREAPWFARVLVSSAFILAMFFSHFLAVGIYGMAIGCCELQRWRETRPGLPRLAADALVLLLPFLLIAPLVLASPTVGFARETRWELWPAKPLGLYFIFKVHSKPLGIAFGVVVAATALWGMATGRLRFHPAGRLFAGLAALVYLAMPFKLMSASFVDVRLPATFMLFLIGMSDWEQRGTVEARRFAVALLAMVALVVVQVAASWARFQPAVAAMVGSFAKIPPGSRILVAIHPSATPQVEEPALVYLPALAMIERSAFYSGAFTHPAQQPLAVREPYRAAASFGGWPLPEAELVQADRHPQAPIADPKDTDPPGHAYWAHWRRDYDYLYVLFPPAGGEPPVSGLEPLERTDFFALYRIAPTSRPQAQSFPPQRCGPGGGLARPYSIRIAALPAVSL